MKITSKEAYEYLREHPIYLVSYANNGEISNDYFTDESEATERYDILCIEHGINCKSKDTVNLVRYNGFDADRPHNHMYSSYILGAPGIYRNKAIYCDNGKR